MIELHERFFATEMRSWFCVHGLVNLATVVTRGMHYSTFSSVQLFVHQNVGVGGGGNGKIRVAASPPAAKSRPNIILDFSASEK